MLLDTIHGLIDRRVLLNYHIDPAALQRVLPAGFRPELFKGRGVGGVCMIRFSELRPRMVPSWLGLKSENAAHPIAVVWDQDDGTHEGVFIPRRDTNSSFNKAFGGRVFPGFFIRAHSLRPNRRKKSPSQSSDATERTKHVSTDIQRSTHRNKVCSTQLNKPRPSSHLALRVTQPLAKKATITEWSCVV
jgi:hypothetical protein